MKLKVFALITAAGISNRMGGVKKEFILIKKHPLLQYTANPFDKSGLINKIFITYTPNNKEMFNDIIQEANLKTQIVFVEGGSSRQQSVYNGLLAMKEENPDIVLIHDGSRPAISKHLIKSVYESTRSHGAAAPVIPITDSLKKTDKHGFLSEHPDRDEFRAIQTPQGFLYKDILEAHIKASTDGREYHDDTEIYSHYIGKVSTVPGCKKNIKITYREDLMFFSGEEQ